MEMSPGIVSLTAMSSNRAIFLCDFDGVINPHLEPYRPYDTRDFYDDPKPDPVVDTATHFALRRGLFQPGRENIFYSPELLSEIDALDESKRVLFVWLSLRGWEMEKLAPMMGVQSPPRWLYGRYFEEQDHNQKYDAMVEVALTSRSGVPIVWIDDVAAEPVIQANPHSLLEGYDDAAELYIHGSPVLVIKPETEEGLTRRHWDAVMAFLNRHQRV